MKILKEDRQAATQFKVSVYKVAQARELRELADSSSALSEEAKEALPRVHSGEMSLTKAYEIVKRARNTRETKLLSAQIRAELVDELHAYCRRHKQLFREAVEEAIILLLLATESTEEELGDEAHSSRDIALGAPYVQKEALGEPALQRLMVIIEEEV
jgi:spore coat protein CotF